MCETVQRDPGVSNLTCELRFEPGTPPFTMPDLFGALRSAIWAELESGGSNVSSMRRALQRAHLGMLVDMVVKPAAGLPADAGALARADLVSLEGALGRALESGQLDSYTSAHVSESRSVIEAALKAGINRKLGG